MEGYDHKEIEQKWRNRWEEKQPWRADDASDKPKYYALVEFPYPSGAGLHVGHPRPYIALDIVSRKRRMEGYNVLYPIGWDAFGLPTENYAIKTGKDPKEVTKENTDTFRKQIQMLGISFDWSREVNTTDPEYYKWTQWIFVQLFKHGLAYKAKTYINWCPKCKIGLANEEVVGGACERCGFSPIEKKEKEQWMLAITKYAQRLYDDLDTVEYIEAAKVGQRNWIGPSRGAEIDFVIKETDEKIRVFTTRPDTLFGATYLVLSPEHSLVKKLEALIKNIDEVRAYQAQARVKTEIERTDETKEKTGVLLDGVLAINPANKETLPVFIADYVLSQYGTGAIMAVPAHDERDFDFAKKFKLPIIEVVSGGDGSGLYTGEGELVNSGVYSGMQSQEAKEKITKFVGGEMKTSYKLRDWVFSRQRYWGEPIPMIYCEKCGWVTVPEEELPVVLPEVEKYEPTETGESPLANVSKWVNTTCPKCGGEAKRETDVMPNWAGSSWYYISYCISENLKSQDPIFKQISSSEIQNKFRYWLPVDWYNGGMEHTTLHLLYSRFWHKFLYDIGVVPTNEPYSKRTSHGLILAEDGRKMSKSFGNVINPDDIVDRFGADAMRVYEMFMGPFEQAIAWSTDGLVGTRRFLERIVRVSTRVAEVPMSDAIRTVIHSTIKKVGEDIESLSMNTAVSQLMICCNELEKETTVSKEGFEMFVCLLAPFAPFLAEELWERLGHKHSVHEEPWPKYEKEALVKKEIYVIIQVNGKVRGKVLGFPGISQDEVFSLVRKDKKLSGYVGDAQPLKVVFVPDRILSIVLR
jgi:leucyl-tRNA synthetase